MYSKVNKIDKIRENYNTGSVNCKTISSVHLNKRIYIYLMMMTFML